MLSLITSRNYSFTKPFISSSSFKSKPIIKRSFYSSNKNLKPVSLAFDHFLPTGELQSDQIIKKSIIEDPIIILHGLFGSRQNWRTLAKRISQNTNREVFVLDQRNHGESPATIGNTTYDDYASDIEAFINENQLKNVNLIGHSMGGKVAMTVALNPNGSTTIKKLIVVDISPMKGKISDEFKTYLNGMKEINLRKVGTRKEADEILSRFEKEIEIRQFLLTNLKKLNHQYQIQLSLEALTQQITSNEVGDFPYDLTTNPTPISTYQNPTMFIKGKSSKYINRHSLDPMKKLFPNHQLIEFDVGHWVHAQKPKEFLESVTEFINKSST
ncbi:alpha/beta hydrolase [Melampsora larici-populina 98AG31]|uniref:Alpha/beta hydrolase n=1 Tax=Melampsora larici-populina (strain 98AG31 / pathotype 3-4-7) TaxID=747676 RepID=F4REK3_MELLP|nr:alpha/beta hydrolase [Melampsora larici-populina 98AG31]EGG09111.1 alpha/beta hydrolase [Melampsora larici-populina 98AG31]